MRLGHHEIRTKKERIRTAYTRKGLHIASHPVKHPFDTLVMAFEMIDFFTDAADSLRHIDHLAAVVPVFGFVFCHEPHLVFEVVVIMDKPRQIDGQEESRKDNKGDAQARYTQDFHFSLVARQYHNVHFSRRVHSITCAIDNRTQPVNALFGAGGLKKHGGRERRKCMSETNVATQQHKIMPILEIATQMS
jgi:hypothetical protein